MRAGDRDRRRYARFRRVPGGEDLGAVVSIENQLADIIESAVRRAVREELTKKASRKAIDETEHGFMSVNAAADFAACSKSTIRRWIAVGDLPAYRHDGIVRVKRAELVALLQPDTRESDDAIARKALELMTD